MTQIDDILTKVINSEGGSTVTNDVNDKGGRTQFGISEKSNPKAWKDGVVTEKEARDIYFTKYVKTPKFDQITNPSLQAQLIDYGVNSGPMIAITKLQGILGSTPDGVLGPNTLSHLSQIKDVNYVNNKLVGERIKMICKIVTKDITQIKYLNGWINRSLEFLV